MRDEFSQILDSAWEETLPGDAKLCLADMKVSKGNTEPSEVTDHVILNKISHQHSEHKPGVFLCFSHVELF